MIWYIAVGSALGGVARYLLGGWIQERAGGTFPLGTLAINVSGSFLLVVLQRWALAGTAVSPEARALLTIGLCGGYTTFSTFSLETLRLLEAGDWRRAGFYVTLSVVLSVGGAILGLLVARELMALRVRV